MLFSKALLNEFTNKSSFLTESKIFMQNRINTMERGIQTSEKERKHLNQFRIGFEANQVLLYTEDELPAPEVGLPARYLSYTLNMSQETQMANG